MWPDSVKFIALIAIDNYKEVKFVPFCGIYVQN